MKSLKLLRLFDDKLIQTRGILLLIDDVNILFQCVTLELPNKNNEKQVSRIPAGLYWVKQRRSQKYGLHFWVQDVDEREMILLHTMNFYTQTKGCIGCGKSYTDLNQDGLLDITESRVTLDKLLALCPDCLQLEIIDTHKLENNPCI